MQTMLQIEEPEPINRPGFALWELGFRPFYLLASVFAALSIPLWALQFSGALQHVYLAGPIWHAHEMLFGFALAVIVGFLLTAGRNWSGHATPSGWSLAALAGLWLAARILVLTPYGWAAAACNVAFPLAAAVALAIPFYKARNTRNYFFVVLLILLALASAFVHLGQLGVLDAPPWVGVQLGLDIVLFIVTVMAGRVIPMFTNNGVPGAGAGRDTRVEKAALGSVLALLVVDAVGLTGVPLAIVAGIAFIAHLARWALWKPWKSLRVPIVWALHLAYLWIPIHLLLRASAAFGLSIGITASHSLTVGAIGGIIIAMMTRTARGHTARPLRADGFDITCYLLVALAALVRVVVPLVAPEHTLLSVQASATLWSAGFGLFAIHYWPVLTRTRLDGKPG